MIRLYHGSNQMIEVPDLVHSKPFKDFVHHRGTVPL